MNGLRQTEQAILAEGRAWTRRRLEQQLQRDADALPALCPQTGASLKDTRLRDLQLETVAGMVKLRVRHGWSEALSRWVCPARQTWALDAYQRTSPELQARLAYTATEVGSYERAARMAQTWGTPVSDGCIHHHVQRLGAAAETVDLPSPPPPPREPEFSLVLQMDGWMARERGPDWGAGPRKKHPQRVAWHEIKSAVLYRLEQRAETASGRGLLLEKFIVATPPETAPVDFGAAVTAEARRRGLGRAQHVYVVIDGAVWLWDLVADRFASAVATLDFHHASEHLWAVAHALHGEGTEAARAWVEPLLHSLRHGQEARVVGRLEQLLEAKAKRTAAEQTVVEREVNYFATHREHLHYQAVAQTGAPIGSGAVESLCGQLQGRLRGRGQFWERPGLTHLLRLTVLFRNHDDQHLWN
jgi:hypothetical protein